MVDENVGEVGELCEEEPLRAARNALERIRARVQLGADGSTVADVDEETRLVERALEVLKQ